MKKIIGLLMLATSIAVTAIAQDEPGLSKAEKTFDLKGVVIKRRFTIELGKGNAMQIEVGDFDDLQKIRNIDSLLNAFLKDIVLFKDSLADELSAKRIDYFIDAEGRKKIRIQVFKPKGSNFLVQGTNIAALKLEQDTVNLIGTVPFTEKHVIGKSEPGLSYYRASFFVNKLSDLNNYADGQLNDKIKAFPENNGRWVRKPDANWYLLKGDQNIHAKNPAGFIGGAGDQIEINAGVNLQNYKNYFVPSFAVNAVVSMYSNRHKYQFGLSWEPQFLFAKNVQGSLVTYRNDFVTLILGREPANRVKTEGPSFNLFQRLTIGYLVRQRGDFYDDHTFRIGTGGFSLHGEKIKIEPLIYFQDFFKRGTVTPGIRLSLNF